jgi:hypothetical protein
MSKYKLTESLGMPNLAMLFTALDKNIMDKPPEKPVASKTSKNLPVDQ